MSPSALDGLVIDLPSVSTSTLAQVQIQTPVMGSATQMQTRSYSLRSRRGGHRKPAVESGGSVTQLIAMAGGQVASDADVEELGNQEGESLQVMLPLSHAKPGRFVFGEWKGKILMRPAKEKEPDSADVNSTQPHQRASAAGTRCTRSRRFHCERVDEAASGIAGQPGRRV